MKVILISIKPKYVVKILNGEKTIEIRKTMPKCDLPIDVYIYCSKDENNGLYWANNWVCVNQKQTISSIRNGKVIAKFTLNKCEDWHFYSWHEIVEKGCVSDKELQDYSRHKKTLYIWHISNLVIFDKPKELSEFYPYCKERKCEYRNNHCSICHRTPLTKAPQNMCYIEVGE